MSTRVAWRLGDALRRRVPVTLFISVVLLLSVVATAVAAQGSNSVEITLEGEALQTPGIVVEGRTVVPLEPFGAEIGFDVAVHSTDDQITVVKDDRRVTLSERRSVALVNGHEVRISALDRPRVIGGTLMVPLRFLLETMGYEVIWTGGPRNSVDLRRLAENEIIIGTGRHRIETATMKIDAQYPVIAGLAHEVQEPMNAFFAERIKPAIEQGFRSDKANKAYEDFVLKTEVVLDYRVAYNQNGFLSIVLDDYIYTGGAHGITGRHGYTVDINTGKTYDLKGLFKPGTDYILLLSEEIALQIEQQNLMLLNPFEMIREDQDFYIEGDALVVYFQQYELMAYAYGFPEFRISMSTLSDVLAPELASISWARAE